MSHGLRTAELPRGIFLWRGWLAIIVLLPALAAALLSRPHFAAGSVPAWACDAVGYGFFIGGILMRTWATLFVGGRKTRSLVEMGPYAVCRNPLYLGSLLIGLSVPFVLQSATLLLATLLLPPIWYAAVIREEERALRLHHPEAFEAYSLRVPRLIPRSWLGAADGEELVVNLKALRAHFRRTAVCLLIPPALELLNHLRSTGAIPALIGAP